MEYRVLPHGGEQVSVIGMGSSVIGAQPEKEIIATVRAAVDSGVNYFDMAGGHAAIFAAYGKALEGIDVGFIHCLDEESDLAAYQEGGVLDYVLALKKQGVIRHIGLSSHTPALVNKVLDRGIVDVVMFSINPAYDYGQGDYGIGENTERYDLYRRCQREGVAITVMKPFCGGQLLDAAQSPFGVALTREQCIQYALDKPGVMAVLPGFGNQREMREVLSFFDASAADRDYSCLGELAPAGAVGRCVYCKHCHPCPAGLDVALINKYYDLAMQGDNLAREHYLTLEKRAGDCVGCGHCDSRCPFHVTQSQRMQTIQTYFGA